ncbi:hypothetical protein BU25DRAFT_422308 [Macroventuria anomochaeta]|uniref:Uncharacterized protein n=1 Tax=Macroventuria anomochaeta TaxID=301207 RepID=A0ACB6RXT5_9PLEO|nr:uncharacterized protein BU25DRAFT_422308 [Macroventuria anomochaeta]KAF2626533.1 hypothetical protein BU25DRAFT_422308 [Macroventuria anomochaeta]
MNHQQAMPGFIFRINEVREHPNVQPAVDMNGNWEPTATPGYNYVVSGGVTNLWWLCDGNRIRPSPLAEHKLPPGMVHYKTYSLFYSDGRGFWVLRGDATNPTHDEPWLPLCFDHDENDGFSSFLTNARSEPALRCRRTDQTWVKMLLPDVNHGSVVVESRQQGALKGELPILLGLLAFSIPIESLQQYLPSMFHSGTWQQYDMANGRNHKRGVIVEVYACPTSNGGTTAEALKDREDGLTGKYYY